jgi:hypothetical protein
MESDPIGLAVGINTFGYVSADPLTNIDRFGLYTIGDAASSLRRRGITRDSFRVRMRYLERLFDEWLALERKDQRWLDELPSCPDELVCDGNDEVWEDATEVGWLLSWLHPDAEWEMRSKPTAGDHSSQCMYDNMRRLIRSIPAAGSADYHSCPNPPFCPGHSSHDLEPFVLARRLDRIHDYYDVRPIK